MSLNSYLSVDRSHKWYLRWISERFQGNHRLFHGPIMDGEATRVEAAWNPHSPEIINLHTETEKRIVELLTKVLPHLYPLDIPCFRSFASLEPADVSSDYWEQETAKGKGAFIQALWTL
ncbi:hypothetical protein TNCV_4490041 [Trichonephila clavipes]|nr:hypothetical protein TNCV_4490041 [Trichonephila clavipes]